jgi:DNA recombination protein RmuC
MPLDLSPAIAAAAIAGVAAIFGAILALLVARLRPPAPDPRLDRLAADLARDGAELRLAIESRLAALAHTNATGIGGLQDSLGSRLHAAVGEEMHTGFERIGAQFAAVQRAVGEVQSSAAEIADLKRLFSSVRARGAWGEGQLRALLDDMLPDGLYLANCRLRPDQAEIVEFAIRMPGPDGRRPLLAIDAKFPTEAYERLLNAEAAGDAGSARLARRSLEAALRIEARRIGSKYIVPPTTVDFAILYLPSDGLYVEASRLPGLLDELGRVQRVMVMGPAILPGLLRSIQLGAMTLAMSERAEEVASLLATTRHDLGRLDSALEKLGRHAAATLSGVEEARRRVRVLNRGLVSATPEGPSDRSAEAAFTDEIRLQFSDR